MNNSSAEKQPTVAEPITVNVDLAANSDSGKLSADLASASASAEALRQSQISPAPSSIAGSSKQQYQPAKCNEERIKQLLLQHSNFTILNENGQRRYSQPGVTIQMPNKGCEVFIGKLPPDCFEDELVPLLERAGKLRELRIMMEYSGTNRGYGFATYESREAAKQAVRELNNYEIRKGKTLGVCLSVDNCRLFVGGIPKLKLKEDVFAEMRQLTEGVVDVIMYPSASDKTKNRGFAFVEYDSHRSAAVARKKLMNGKAQLWGHPIAVDWAEPERFVDEDVMATVKILYVRNLMLTTTEEKLREVFGAVCEKADAVERVKKIRDYAFVHFRERTDALKCRDVLNNTYLEGTTIEVCLAKPVDKSERQQAQANANASALHGANLINSNSVTPLLSSAMPMYFDPTMLAVAGGLALPMPQMLGLPPVSSALLDPAKLLAMQNAAMVASRQQSASTSSRNGSGRQSHGEQRAAHGTKRRQQFSGRSAAAKEHQTTSNSFALQQGSQRKAPEILEEFCQQHGLGSPIYNLHTTISNAGVDLQMYLFKVTLPMTGMTFTPTRLCANVEEARQFAAEFVLQQITQQSPLLTAPLVSPSEDMRMALPNPLLGNMGGIYPFIHLPQFVPTLSPTAIAPFLLPPAMAAAAAAHATPQQQHAAAQSNINGQLGVGVGGRAGDGKQHAIAAAQQARFDAGAPQYYDASMSGANATYLPAQPMQAGPQQANVAY